MSCSKSQVSKISGCKSFSFSEEVKFYSDSFSQDWLLTEISPDSVQDFYFRTIFDFYDGSSVDQVTQKGLTDDELFIFNSEKLRSKQFSESFQIEYESGNHIWSFDNTPSKPGNLGWEYGLLILEGCHLKYIRPIKQS